MRTKPPPITRAVRLEEAQKALAQYSQADRDVFASTPSRSVNLRQFQELLEKRATCYRRLFDAMEAWATTSRIQPTEGGEYGS